MGAQPAEKPDRTEATLRPRVVAEVQPFVREEISHRRRDEKQRDVARRDHEKRGRDRRRHASEKEEQHHWGKQDHLEIARRLVGHRLVRKVPVVLLGMAFEEKSETADAPVHRSLVTAVLDEVRKEKCQGNGRELGQRRRLHPRDREGDDGE